jgi:hypothetical protein
LFQTVRGDAVIIASPVRGDFHRFKLIGHGAELVAMTLEGVKWNTKST